MDFIEACRKFIEIDTTPASGTLEIAQYAADLCREAGLFVEIHNETFNGVDQANLIARPVKTRPNEELLLQTHLDTREPGNYALWTRTGANPFNASIYGDLLYGLGAADTKLDFLCKLQAIREIQETHPGVAWKLPFALVGTYGEESGLIGAIKLVRKKLISSKMALVGEPTELKPVYAGKGYAAVEIEIPFSEEEKAYRAQHDAGDGSTTQSRVFVGKAAHSSVPHLGDSAISRMLDYLGKLPDGLAVMEMDGGISFNSVPAHAVLEIDMVGGLRDTISEKLSTVMRVIAEIEKQFAAYPDSEFTPPTPTLNIGMIRTYEDYVKISGCCRLPPTVSEEIYEGWMSILRDTCQNLGGVFRIIDHKRPFRTSVESPLLLACRDELEKMGQSSECMAQSVANEANVFCRFGIECVVIGPGRGVGNTHAPDEYVSLDQLHGAVRLYKRMLERICL